MSEQDIKRASELLGRANGLLGCVSRNESIALLMDNFGWSSHKATTVLMVIDMRRLAHA